MTAPVFRIPRLPVLLLLLLGCVLPLSAAMEDWVDTQGRHFKAEAAQVLGPFALFREASGGGCRLLLTQLPPDECVRFARGLGERPGRAQTWEEAGSLLSGELRDTLQRVGDTGYTPVESSSIPEPELYLVLNLGSDERAAHSLLRSASRVLRTLNTEFPGMLEGVLLSYDQNPEQRRHLAQGAKWPGLVPDTSKLPKKGLLETLFRKAGPALVVLSREGVPVLNSEHDSANDLSHFLAAARELLSICLPENPKSWPQQAYYARTIRPVLFASKDLGPLLIGNPLRSPLLAQSGVRFIDAQLQVDAEGAITTVQFSELCEFPEPLRQPLAQAIGHGFAMLPALHKGQPVAGSYHFRADLRNASTLTRLADLVGFHEIHIPRWLVLRPIRVSTLPLNAGLNRELGDGTVLMTPVYVGANLKGAPPYREQRRAFLTDWWEEEEDGIASVKPAAGKEEYVWGEKYTWKVVETPHDIIDFQEGERLNWVIAYAYAEFEVSRAMKAFIGMGSDDAAHVWLNGVQVHENWVNRAVTPNQDLFPVMLKAGKNVVLVKVQNFLMPHWGMQLQLFTPTP